MDLGRAVNSAAGWLCASPAIRAVAGNPFYTAMLLTALAAVVGMASWGKRRPEKKDKVRALLYFFLGATMVLVVNYYAVRQEIKVEAESEGVRRVFTGLDTVKGFGGGVAVIPRTTGLEKGAPLLGIRGGAEGEGAGEMEWPGGGGRGPEEGSVLAEALAGARPLKVEDVRLGATLRTNR
jgi:hypothetical protein